MNARPRALGWLGGAALYAALFALYWPSVRYLPISLDDFGQLELAAKQSLAQIFAPDHYGHARPVKNALFWLFARWPAWTLWRALLLGLLLAVTALVQRLARRLTGSPAAGLATAALWALHPMTASVTCWLSAANVALCALGVLLYLEWGARVAAPAGTADRRWSAFALLSLAFALLGHELAIVAPVLLWLQQRVLARGSSMPPAARRLYLASAAAVVLFIGYALVIGEAHGRYRFSTEPRWSMSASAARYLFDDALLWLLPVGRFGVLLGDRPAEHLLASAAAWLALIAACFAAWRWRERDRVLSFGLAWTLVTLAPVANFVPLGNTPVAMHYAYVPGVGLSLALVRALSALVGRTARARPGAPALALALVLTAGAGAYLLPETARAIHAWGDAERLFATTTANYPREVEPLVNLTAVYLDRRRYDLASAALDRARALAPDDPGVVRNGFSLLWQTDRIAEALALLDRHPAVAERPELQLGRGQALARLGRSAEAAEVLRRVYESPAAALDDEQRFAAGLHLLIVLVRSERRADAERLLDRLLQRYPEREELRSAAQLLRGQP